MMGLQSNVLIRTQTTTNLETTERIAIAISILTVIIRDHMEADMVTAMTMTMTKIAMTTQINPVPDQDQDHISLDRKFLTAWVLTVISDQ